MKAFSYSEYEQILRQVIESRYRMVDYKTAKRLVDAGDDCRFAVLRHDVDLDPEKALRMAEIEHEYRVRSTFFFLVSSDVYNVFSRSVSRSIDRILAMGHMLGLHFDFATCGPDSAVYRLGLEKEMLKRRFGSVVDAVSYHCYRHIPPGFVGSSTLIDAYQEPFMTRIRYFADSYGTWRYGHPLNSREFREGKPLHLNFHPMWWDERPRPRILGLSEFARKRDRALKWSISRNIWGF